LGEKKRVRDEYKIYRGRGTDGVGSSDRGRREIGRMKRRKKDIPYCQKVSNQH